MNSTTIGPAASKISEENVLPVTVPMLSLDPRVRGVVRGTSNVSFVIRAYLSELFERFGSKLLSPTNFTGTRDGPRFASLIFVCQESAAYQRTSASSEQECSLLLSL